ncbi:hypothetical protein N9T71_02455 [Alphaproteobacteria bacterium]|nr:hypothetical protein [Alphaproteobacteria bacterium]
MKFNILNLYKLTSSIALISLVSTFIFLNIKQINDGSGNNVLMTSFLIWFVFLIFKKEGYVIGRIKKTHFYIYLFLIYFFSKIIYDSFDSEFIKAYTYRTDNGLIMYLFLGSLISYAFYSFTLLLKNKNFNKIVNSFLIFYLILVLLGLIFAFEAQLVDIRHDVFLINNSSAAYQRPANLLIIQNLINTTILTLLFINRNIVSGFSLKICMILNFSYALLSALFSQLIGSNAGLVVTLSIFITLLIFIYVIKAFDYKMKNSVISFQSIFTGWLGLKILKALFIIFTISIPIIIFIYFNYSDKVTLLRISGFGAWNSLLESRIEIFLKNFMSHFLVNPFFGNMHADALTTGDGTHIHSFLSIIPHLGILGLILFIIFMYEIYMDIKRNSISQNYFSFDIYSYQLFRFLILILLLGLCTAITFFTWPPLWFSLGLFGIGVSPIPRKYVA